jgi:hypothetical protein
VWLSCASVAAKRKVDGDDTRASWYERGLWGGEVGWRIVRKALQLHLHLHLLYVWRGAGGAGEASYPVSVWCGVELPLQLRCSIH